MTFKKNTSENENVRRITHEDLRPSEILKRDQDKEREQRKKVRLERDAEITAKANPHIEALHKYINEPEEIKAYLILNKDAEYLTTAIDEVFWKECHIMGYVFTKNETLQSNENNIIVLSSISNILIPEQKPDLDLFEKTDAPQFFESLLILANHLRRNSPRNYIFDETIGIVSEKKLGESGWRVIDGTEDLDETADNRTLFMWKRVEKFLPTLTDDLARLDYLINIRARFNKMPEGARKSMNPDENFSHNASVEIERIEKLVFLEQTRKKQKAVSNVSGFERTRIIDAAVRLTETRGKWTEIDLIEELDMVKTTFYNKKKQCGWERIRMLKDEAQAIIREKNK